MDAIKRQKRGETYHLKTFMGGQMTPKEAHIKYAFGGRACDKCGAPAEVCVRTFGEIKEVSRRSPQFLMQLARDNDGQVPMVDFTYGKFVAMGRAYACKNCERELEVEAAKAPSWCLVEIDKGPKDTITEQVAEQLSEGA